MIHELKCWPAFFEQLAIGTKTAELRRDDRAFKVGDTLWLREWAADGFEVTGISGGYTGRELARTITHIVRGEEWGLCGGFVMLSLRVGSMHDVKKKSKPRLPVSAGLIAAAPKAHGAA